MEKKEGLGVLFALFGSAVFGIVFVLLFILLIN